MESCTVWPLMSGFFYLHVFEVHLSCTVYQYFTPLMAE